jgi:hypothetical protein
MEISKDLLVSHFRILGVVSFWVYPPVELANLVVTTKFDRLCGPAEPSLECDGGGRLLKF